MWIAVAVVLVFNVLRFATVDYGAASLEVVVRGIDVEFAEEVLTCGFVVRLTRAVGHRELSEAPVSVAVCAGLHAVNLFTGRSPFATALRLVYTFAFGICMYLAPRVTYSLRPAGRSAFGRCGRGHCRSGGPCDVAVPSGTIRT